MPVTGTLLRKVAQQVGDALWELADDQLRRKHETDNVEGPHRER
ncbi:hypothetical protein [Streptomyces sp. NPDC006668]